MIRLEEGDSVADVAAVMSEEGEDSTVETTGEEADRKTGERGTKKQGKLPPQAGAGVEPKQEAAPPKGKTTGQSSLRKEKTAPGGRSTADTTMGKGRALSEKKPEHTPKKRRRR